MRHEGGYEARAPYRHFPHSKHAGDSKALAALAHSGKSPAAGPLTTCEDLRIHTYSVIAHADSKIGIAKGDLALDVARLCKLVRIADRSPPSPATRLTAYSQRLF